MSYSWPRRVAGWHAEGFSQDRGRCGKTGKQEVAVPLGGFPGTRLCWLRFFRPCCVNCCVAWSTQACQEGAHWMQTVPDKLLAWSRNVGAAVESICRLTFQWKIPFNGRKQLKSETFLLASWRSAAVTYGVFLSKCRHNDTQAMTCARVSLE